VPLKEVFLAHVFPVGELAQAGGIIVFDEAADFGAEGHFIVSEGKVHDHHPY
jgi:hypothetical protein